MIMKAINKVKEFIIENRMINSGDRIVVGVSGGADSVCLVLMLKELSNELNCSISIVNVEHGIRGDESKNDSIFVEELATKLNIPFFGYSIDVPELARRKKQSLETAARNARYEAFEKATAEFGANKIAVAHNKNDNSETIIFNMVRGTSLTGIAGINPVNGQIIRPLLVLTREEIEYYLSEINAKYVTDSTNLETEYTRNKIRLQVMPHLTEINQEAINHINALGNDVKEYLELVNDIADKAFEKSVTQNETKVSVNIPKLNQELPLIKREVIKRCIYKLSGACMDISRTNIQAVMDLMNSGTGKSVSLPYGIVVKTSYADLVFEKTAEESNDDSFCAVVINVPGETITKTGRMITSFAGSVPLEIEKKEYTKLIDYDRIKNGLELRHRRSGDVLVTGKDGGHTKLKDYFINEKVPKDLRDKLLLLCDGNEVIWVVGMRLSEKYKISDKTKNVLIVEFMEDKNG